MEAKHKITILMAVLSLLSLFTDQFDKKVKKSENKVEVERQK